MSNGLQRERTNDGVMEISDSADLRVTMQTIMQPPNPAEDINAKVQHEGQPLNPENVERYEGTQSPEHLSNKMKPDCETAAGGQTQPKEIDTRVKFTEAEELSKEIKLLETKLGEVDGNSMEKMFLEMRIDMKKDSLKMIKRFDNLTISTNSLSTQVHEMKSNLDTTTTKVNNLEEKQNTEIG